MILDICGALAALLEPDPTARVALDIEPLIWDAGKTYVYPLTVDEVPFETGSARRQLFDLNAVSVYSNEGEEATQARSPALAQTLDDRRGAFLAAVRTNQSTTLWGQIAGRVDTTEPRTLDKRSAAIRISGWRIIGG